MLKIERKLAEFAEKHLIFLCGFLLTVIGLYLRKAAIWWSYGNIGAYFDMHADCCQTVFYYRLVWWMQNLPALPLHSVKWLAGLADFGIAGLMVRFLGKEADSAKRLIFYAVCVFSPILFLRGVTWGQTDSVGILLLLAGYIIREKKVNRGGMSRTGLASLLLAGAGIALCPWLLWAAFLYLWKQEKEQRTFWPEFLTLTAWILVFQLFSALSLGLPWQEGLYSLFRYLTFHPESGMQYDNVAEWLQQIIIQTGAAASILALWAAGKRKCPYIAAIVIQAVSAVVCGNYLFREI